MSLPYTWAPKNNTAEQSHAIPVNLVKVRNEEEMKVEGREVLGQMLDAGLIGRGLSVVGDRRGLDLVAEMRKRFAFLENQIVQLEQSAADRAMAISALSTEIGTFKRMAANNVAGIATLIDRTDTLKDCIVTLKDRIDSLEDQVLDICLASKEDGRLRQRFPSTYNRNAKMTLSEEDWWIIMEGNPVARFGDAIVD